MKKILSLALAAAMAVSVLPVAYALEGENTYDNNYQGDMGTQITMVGTQEAAAGGAGDVWTVTVPAKMVPGDTGTVKAEGMWAADKYLQVTAPKTVSLSYGAQTMDVGITFGGPYDLGIIGFALLGSSTEEVTASYDLTVEDASRLFGTWTGTLTYDVDLVEKGDINRDGVIDAADISVIREMIAGTVETDLTYADMKEDGSVDGNDITVLKRILTQNGLPTE